MFKVGDDVWIVQHCTFGKPVLISGKVLETKPNTKVVDESGDTMIFNDNNVAGYQYGIYQLCESDDEVKEIMFKSDSKLLNSVLNMQKVLSDSEIQDIYNYVQLIIDKKLKM